VGTCVALVLVAAPKLSDLHADPMSSVLKLVINMNLSCVFCTWIFILDFSLLYYCCCSIGLGFFLFVAFLLVFKNLKEKLPCRFQTVAS